jgi:hypothetical protein
VPARLVIGYQGAQFNPYKNIYVVKQSNAHCWDEVWIDSEKTWERVDPTAVLSNSERSLAATLAGPPGQTPPGLSIDIAHHRLTLVSGSSMPTWLRRALVEAQLRRQELEADWDDWVFSYDTETQGKLAQALGFGGVSDYALGLSSILALVLCGVLLAWMVTRRTALTPVESFYAKFCRDLARLGLERAAWEGPLSFTQRAAEAFPEQRTAIQRAGQIVIDARYAPAAPAVALAEMKSLLSAINRTA